MPLKKNNDLRVFIWTILSFDKKLSLLEIKVLFSPKNVILIDNLFVFFIQLRENVGEDLGSVFGKSNGLHILMSFDVFVKSEIRRKQNCSSPPLGRGGFEGMERTELENLQGK